MTFRKIFALAALLAVVTAFGRSGGRVAVAAAKLVYSDESKKPLPIYSVETPEKKIAVTFDAAWGDSDCGRLLEILEDFDAKATFFVCGYWAEKYPETIRKIQEAGHEIGNHGDTHAHVARLDREGNLKEIKGAHEKVRALLGTEMTVYRPPYGEYNDTVINAAREAGYYPIQWDVDSHDWMKKGAEREVSQVLRHKNLGSGSILLFHCDTPDTPEALPRILSELKKQGYEFVSVSELIMKSRYYIDVNGRQRELGS
ncbi:MAG: polysaccharide deacetylase family protein [Clostridiales bacterium]|jgi:polysaccharide deacetylase family sporulation protein PdaB|nr:polysaccharide deacetylase family protein [Clostridiales bacterium]